MVTVELGVGTGAWEETVMSTVEELEVAAVGEREKLSRWLPWQ